MTIESELKEFNDELKKLLGKYGFSLTATPFINQDGRIGAKPQVIKAPKVEDTTTSTTMVDENKEAEAAEEVSEEVAEETQDEAAKEETESSE